MVNAFRDIFLHDCYGTEVVGRTVRTVLDIGANAGFFSLCARNAFPNAVIHTYEPNPQVHEIVSFHAKKGNFTLFPEAVGGEWGRVRMVADESSTVYAMTIADKEGTVPMIPFSECVNRLGGAVNFVKMDAEGAEWDMFRKSEGWENVGFLALEFHEIAGHTREECARILTNLGFELLRPSLSGPQYHLIWSRR
jgi:FkbM family methyltransferase